MHKTTTVLTLSILLLGSIPFFTSDASAATEIRIREYSVFEGEETGTGTDSFQFNATPLSPTGTVNTSQSNTYLKLWASANCEPTGIQACNVAFSWTSDNGSGPAVFATNQLVRDAGADDDFASWYEIHSLGAYRSDTTWINVSVTDVNSNADRERYGFQVWQREVYTIEVDANGNPIEPQDHNVTIIEGNPEINEMRIYGWIIGLAVALLVLAEWRKDPLYYILSAISLAYATINYPSFLPQTLQFVPLVIGIYIGTAMWREYKAYRSRQAEV